MPVIKPIIVAKVCFGNFSNIHFSKFENKIALGLDAKDGNLFGSGWKENLNIKTIVYCDDKEAPAQNFCDEFVFAKYNDKDERRT